MATLAQVVWTTWAVHADDVGAAVRRDRKAALIMTLSYLVVSVGVMVASLT